jgi:hypothetical protein
MSITNLIRKAAIALASILLLTPILHAQHGEFQPLFEDPLAFNPDYQFFAPIDLGDFGEKPDPRSGWFGQYRRSYTFVSRPNGEIGHTEGDYTWGNHYDIGYMTESGSGWFVTGTHIDGPNVYDVVIHPRVNRINNDDVPMMGMTLDPVFPIQGRNDIITGARDLFLTDSINAANVSGFEVNKSWRLERFHNGSVIEPFLGVRYFKLGSLHRRDLYHREDATFIDNPEPNVTDVIEDITSINSVWENHMVGGQLGLRWSDRRGRMTMSSEFRGFGAQNFQAFTTQNDNLRILYSGVADDATILSEQYTRTRSSASGNEFVFGVDVRAEAAFALTRDISLSAGVHVSQIAQGIARGNNPVLNEEQFTQVGFLMGVDINR